jgi:hypothetical protein
MVWICDALRSPSGTGDPQDARAVNFPPETTIRAGVGRRRLGISRSRDVAATRTVSRLVAALKRANEIILEGALLGSCR